MEPVRQNRILAPSERAWLRRRARDSELPLLRRIDAPWRLSHGGSAMLVLRGGERSETFSLNQKPKQAMDSGRGKALRILHTFFQ
jgi:hypothetical protein